MLQLVWKSIFDQQNSCGPINLQVTAQASPAGKNRENHQLPVKVHENGFSTAAAPFGHVDNSLAGRYNVRFVQRLVQQPRHLFKQLLKYGEVECL